MPNISHAFRLVVFWGTALSVLSLALLPAGAALTFGNDKTAHVAAFFVLSGMAAAAFPRKGSLGIFLWMACLGACIELLQLMPQLHREAELKDWLADCMASGAALLLGNTLCLARRTG